MAKQGDGRRGSAAGPRRGVDATSGARAAAPGTGPARDGNADLAETMNWFGPAFARWTAGLLPHEETTHSRARVLSVLQRNGPQIMSRVKDELGLTAASMTALVDGLEREGMLRREPHPTDRRSTVLVLTTAGEECDLSDRYNALAGDLFSGLTDAQRTAFADVLDTVAGTLRHRLQG